MNYTKTILQKSKAVATAGLLGFLLSIPRDAQAVVTIAHVENTTVGGFLTSAGTTVSAGEVSFGFFTNNLSTIYSPTITQIRNIGSGAPESAWDAILALGFNDVRKYGTLGAGFDAAFPLNIGATVQNIPFATLPANTQLYLFGFNAGSWNNTTKTASFGLASEWAAVSIVGRSTSADNWLSPADGGTKALNFAKLQSSTAASDILVGSLGSAIGSTGYNVIMIPEPSIGSLLVVGLALCARRRKIS